MKAGRTSKAVIGMLLLATLAWAPAVDAATPAVSALSVNNADFSPNGDGSKDTTTLSVTLSSAWTGSLYANVYDAEGDLVRTGIPLTGSGTAWSGVWNGKSDLEATVADGTYAIKVSGNGIGDADEVAASSASVVVDTAAPTGLSVLITGTDAANAFTNSRSVALTLAATGATQMAFANTTSSTCPDSSSFSASETFATSRTYTLPTGDGTKRVCFRAKDDAGNLATPVSATIILDTTGPTSGRVQIEADASSTRWLVVNLTITGTGASFMRFSNNGGTTWSSWETFATSKSGWDLSSNGGGTTAGTKGVAIQLKDAAGNSADGTSDTITLDQTAPSVTTDPSTSDVTSTGATVSWGTDEASASYVEYGTSSGTYTLNSGWQQTSLTASHSVTLTSLAPGATYYYRVKSRDAAGNVGTSSESNFQTSSTVTNVPRDLIVSINDGATYTNSRFVTLALSGTEVSNYMLSNGNNTFTSNATFTPTVSSWDLVTNGGFDGDGPKTVTFKGWNSQGASATNAVDTIILDRAAPAVTFAGAGAGGDGTSLTISWTTDEAATGTVTYGTAADALTSTATSAQGTSHSVSLTGLTAGQTYYYKIRATDLAGNSVIDASARSVTTASVAPTGVSVVFATGTPTVTSNPTVSLTVAATGANHVQFSNDNTTWSTVETFRTSKTWNLTSGAGGSNTDGPKKVYVRVNNSVGATVRETALSVLLDRVAPVPTGPATAEQAWASTSPTLAVAASDAVGLASLQYKVTSGPTNTGTVRVDWTAIPGLTVSGTSVTGSLTVPAASLGQGLNYVSLRATDTAGNAGTVRDLAIIRYDSQGPPSSMTALAATTLGIPVALAWSASDAFNSVATYTLQMKHGAGDWTTVGSGWANTSASMTLVDGTHSFRVLAVDSLGNTFTPSAAQATTLVDLAVPSAPVVTATAGTNQIALSWAAATDANGITAYRVLVASAADGTFTQTGSDLANTATSYTYATGPGTLFFKVRAVDGAGRMVDSAAASATVAAPSTGGSGGNTGGGSTPSDTTAPAITAFAPTGTVTTAQPTLTATYSDAGGISVSDIVVTLDGAVLTGTRTATGFAITPPADLAAGLHAVRLVVTDTAGNSVTKEWTFTVPGADPVPADPEVPTEEPEEETPPTGTPHFVLDELLVTDAFGTPVVEYIAGQPIYVDATVTNDGDAEGSYPVKLRVNGELVADDEITLAPGESQTVSFEYTPEEAGTYLLQLNTLEPYRAKVVAEKATPTPTVSVTPPAPTVPVTPTAPATVSTPAAGTPSVNSEPKKEEKSGGVPGFEVVALLGAALAAVAALGRRRRG